MAIQTYRSEMYEHYVTTQFPGWAEANPLVGASWRKAVLHRLRSWLPDNRDARCLDLGCGAGELMLALQGEGYRHVAGVDLGPEAVEIARGRGLNVTLGDVRTHSLKAATGAYDLICAFDLVEHFRKDELLDLLRLIHRSLSPGGVFIFQTPNAMSPWACDYRYADFTHELLLSQRSAEAVLKLTGFRNVAVREVAPFVHGPASAIRAAIWLAIHAGCAIWNLAETGRRNGGIYTRNMLVKAGKL